jgi:hypothetical protein
MYASTEDGIKMKYLEATTGIKFEKENRNGITWQK